MADGRRTVPSVDWEQGVLRLPSIARAGVGVASTSYYEKTKCGHWPPCVPLPDILELRLQESFDKRQQLAPFG
ncbi:hypothetical protein B0T13DRAFT_314890 [Neurospora crassa]|nr:hypothetical protein B0T13DRAFT_314890 [Neurospora crassa]